MNPGATNPRATRRLLTAFRLIVAALLVAYFFARADPQLVLDALTGVAGAPLVIVVALVLIDRALMAYRWFVLLRPLEREHLPPFRVILEVFFVSTFLGTFLPGSIGGDVVRAYRLSALGVSVGDATASVFVDRMLGVLSLLLMALVSLTIAADLLTERGILVGLAGAATACAVAAMLMFSRLVGNLADATLTRVPLRSLQRLPSHVLASIRRYAHHRGLLSQVLAASVAVQVLRILQAYYLGAAVGLTQPAIVYFAFVPLILLIMLLPITVNGIGTSQAAFIWLFGRVHTPDHDAFVLSVLFVGLQIVGNIPGAIFVIGNTFSDPGSQARTH